MNRKLLAWAVHCYTASGGIIGLFALYAASQGEIRGAFLLLLATLVIDTTDGSLARRLKIKDALPNFSGAEIDNVIDFLTYVWIPAFIMWKVDLLPHPLLTAIPIIAALYAYGQVDMKSADGYFIGFPSYWNIIALYLFWLRPDPIISSLLVIIPGILSFIPTRYLYPSRGGILWRTTWVLTAVWILLILYLLALPEPPHNLVVISVLYPLYYMAASFYAEFQYHRERRVQAVMQ
jgi:phosphatidylcholine synthase